MAPDLTRLGRGPVRRLPYMPFWAAPSQQSRECFSPPFVLEREKPLRARTHSLIPPAAQITPRCKGWCPKKGCFSGHLKTAGSRCAPSWVPNCQRTTWRYLTSTMQARRYNSPEVSSFCSLTARRGRANVRLPESFQCPTDGCRVD